MKNIILELVGLHKVFGGVTAVNRLNLSVEAGDITSVIGPNGAGKTTIFNLVTGYLKPSDGVIKYCGNTVSGKSPHMIAGLGIARTFQNVQIFPNMSILENSMVGRHLRSSSGLFSSLFVPPFFRKEEKKIRAGAKEWLSFIGMEQDGSKSAGSLPLGSQRKLEIARALSMEPKLILLDEPASGLNARETVKMGELIGRIKDLGITVILVEHDMELVMDISDVVMVINFGEQIANGTPAEVQVNKDVIAAYLGE